MEFLVYVHVVYFCLVSFFNPCGSGDFIRLISYSHMDKCSGPVSEQ